MIMIMIMSRLWLLIYKSTKHWQNLCEILPLAWPISSQQMQLQVAMKEWSAQMHQPLITLSVLPYHYHCHSYLCMSCCCWCWWYIIHYYFHLCIIDAINAMATGGAGNTIVVTVAIAIACVLCLWWWRWWWWWWWQCSGLFRITMVMVVFVCANDIIEAKSIEMLLVRTIEHNTMPYDMIYLWLYGTWVIWRKYVCNILINRLWSFIH